MYLLMIVAAAVLTGCGPGPRPLEPPKPDPTAEAWYGQTVEELTALNREAEGLLRRRKSDQAAAVIMKAQPLMNRLLAVPRPTLAAMEAVSDSDDRYGRMLLANGHYGWARLLFQKNVARWKNWVPQNQETARRRKLAESGAAECDRRMAAK